MPSITPTALSGSKGGKCFPLFIGGPSLQDGQTLTSIQPRCCDRLRCFDCDKKVVKYSNSKWKTTVDYLFVRNHLTNPKELVKVRIDGWW